MSAKTIICVLGILVGSMGMAAASGAAKSDRVNMLALTISSKRQANLELNRLAGQATDPTKRMVLLERRLESLGEIARLQAELTAELPDTGKSPAVESANREVVFAATRFLEGFPNSRLAPRAYFLRGEAERGLGQDDAALADLGKVIASGKRGPDEVSASLLTYDLLTKKKSYQAAIDCLQRLDARPGQNYYPLVAEYLGWSFYYLGRDAEAADRLENLIRFYRRQGAKTSLERKHLYHTLGLFLAAGVEARQEGFGIAPLTRRLEDLAPSDEKAAAILALAVALSAENLNEALDQLLAELDQPSEKSGELSFRVRLIALDSLLNVRKVAAVIPAVQRLSGAMPASLDDKLQASLKKQLIRASDLMLKEPKPDRAAMSAAYGLLLQLPESDPSRLLAYHYNLAELAFDAKDFEKATSLYRWTVEHGKRSSRTFDSGLKAIAARFETLKARKLIPQDLKPVAAQKAEPAPLDPLFTEWVKWVGEYRKSSQDSAAVRPFVFEMYRALYMAGHIERALEGMRKLASLTPPADCSAAAASLVVDTEVAEERWEDAYRDALAYARVPTWRNGDFNRRLMATATQVADRQVAEDYQAKRFDRVLSRLARVEKELPSSEQMARLESTGAFSALALGQRELASQYLDKIREGRGPAELKHEAVQTKAAMEEEDFKYRESAEDLIPILSVSSELRHRALHDARLAGEAGLLDRALEACPAGADETCAYYRILSRLSSSHDCEPRPLLAKLAASPLERIAAESTLLDCQAGLGIDEKRKLLDRLDPAPPVDDPALGALFLSASARQLPALFETFRKSLLQGPKLELTDRSLSSHVGKLREGLARFSRFYSSPVAEVRASALLESSLAYLQLIQALDDLPVPRELSAADREAYRKMIASAEAPFVAKRKELAAKAFSVAAEKAVDPTLFEEVFGEYASALVDETEALKSNWSAPDPVPSVEQVWTAAFKADTSARQGFLKAWNRYLERKDWAAVALLLRDAKAGKALSASEVTWAGAAWLEAAGVSSRGLETLEQGLSSGDLAPEAGVCRELVANFMLRLAKEKTKKVLERCAAVLADDFPGLVGAGVRWASPDLPEGLRLRFSPVAKLEKD